jgi:hypothetical protein
MSTMKKPAMNVRNEERLYPAAAYEYRDDVTPETVDKMRRKAAPIVDKAKLKLIDGLGRYSA